MDFINTLKVALKNGRARLTFIAMVLLCVLSFFVPKVISNPDAANFVVLAMALVAFTLIGRFSRYFYAVREAILAEKEKKEHK